MHDSAESCASPKESIGAGGYTGDVGLTAGEESRVRSSFVEGLDQDSHSSAKGRADSHGWDKDTRRDFTAVGNDDEENPNHCGYAEREYHMPAAVLAKI